MFNRYPPLTITLPYRKFYLLKTMQLIDLDCVAINVILQTTKGEIKNNT